MNSIEYPVFCVLLYEVHEKAFREPLGPLPFRKATALSFLIEEITGQLISYKTLHSYVKAVLTNKPASINPNISTLDILASFAREKRPGKYGLAWYHFRDETFKTVQRDQYSGGANQLSLHL